MWEENIIYKLYNKYIYFSNHSHWVELSNRFHARLQNLIAIALTNVRITKIVVKVALVLFHTNSVVYDAQIVLISDMIIKY